MKREKFNKFGIHTVLFRFLVVGLVCVEIISSPSSSPSDISLTFPLTLVGAAEKNCINK
jgi:hypothetical protein